RHRIDCRQVSYTTVEGARHRRIPRRVARDIDGGSRVRVNLKRGRDALFCRQQTGHIRIELADLAICARCSYTIAIRWAGWPTNKVISFIGGEDKEGIAFIDPVPLQPLEECTESLVV